MGDNPKHGGPESEQAIDDLDVPSEEAAEIVGGRTIKPPDTPATPPGVPIPYPNVSGPKPR